MDWKRAKTQMIYVFIMLNVVLFVMLYRNRSVTDDRFDIDKELKKFDIALDADIPDGMSVNGLELVYRTYETEVLKKSFFKKPTVLEQGDTAMLEEGNKRVTLFNRKLLNYVDKPELYKGAKKLIHSSTEAEEFAKKFLEEHGLYDRLIMVNSDIRYNLYSIEFEEVDKETGLILENAYTNLSLNDYGVVSMTKLSFAERIVKQNRISLDNPKRRLMKIVNMTECYGRTIKDIKLCYLFDPASIPYINNSDKVTRGVASLALRVTLDNGFVVLIE